MNLMLMYSLLANGVYTETLSLPSWVKEKEKEKENKKEDIPRRGAVETRSTGAGGYTVTVGLFAGGHAVCSGSEDTNPLYSSEPPPNRSKTGPKAEHDTLSVA
jgi:hypothetical protein